MKSQTELRDETFKEKLKYGGLGLVCGAVIAMIIGFAWGGWTTTGTTKRMTKEAVLASQAAICVAQFMKEPNQGEKLKEFEKLNSAEKVNFIEKGDWATMPGGEKADLYACRACADGLELLIKK
jgi:predicted negative regulator of RcsB-dependent stress response